MIMELIDKSKVVAEIEKMLQNEYPCDNSEQETGYDCALYELQDFLDTLEVKEVEEPSKSLEDEATKYAQDKYMPVQTAEAFRAGYKKCRQEMMNSAIEREVKVDAGGYPYIDATELYDYSMDKPLAKAGDKIKVVFIKDK
jgi:hypothetical protein